MNLPNPPPRSASVFLTQAPTDAAHGLDARHNTDDLGVIHVTASVSDTKLADAAMTILWALGKRPDVAGTQVHISDNVTLAPVWLTAHHTQTVLLSAPHRWHPRLLHETLRVVLAAGTNVVLVADREHYTDTHEITAGYLPIEITFDALHELVPIPKPADVPATATSHNWSQTPVPDSNWPTFRAECRDTLPPELFSEIDTTYRQALQHTRRTLKHTPSRDNDNTRSLLVDLLEPTTHRAFATTALRAAQAAHFEAGLNLRIDPTEAVALMTKTRDIAFTDQDWRSIRAYREPARAAACVLYGLQVPVAHIETFTIAQTDNVINAQQLQGQTLHPDALAVLRAARLERSLDQATPTDLLITHRKPALILTQAAHDLGLIITSTANRRSVHTKNQWRYRIGFTLRKIKNT